VHYHLTGNGESVAQAYDLEQTAAREKEAMAVMGSEVNEASLARLMADEKMMADASKLFGSRCGPCHAQKGEGLIGPNLTDGQWIHGQPELMNIHTIIAEGLQNKGMPPWKRQLSPIELGKLSAFVGSIVGSNVAGKAPEGNRITVRPGQVSATAGSDPSAAAPEVANDAPVAPAR
jgi:cytochrome c oxidase cbb3-type subunit 3